MTTTAAVREPGRRGRLDLADLNAVQVHTHPPLYRSPAAHFRASVQPSPGASGPASLRLRGRVVSGYVTVPDLAARTGISEQAVRKHIRAGRLQGKAMRWGRDWLIPVSVADGFADWHAQHLTLQALRREYHRRQR